MSKGTSPSSIRGIGVKVLRYLESHANVTVYRDDIARDLGLTSTQATAAVYSLWYRDTNNAKAHLEIIAKGQAWCWHSQSPNQRKEARVKRIFEEVGPTKDDAIIIEDADSGKLYKAIEL